MGSSRVPDHLLLLTLSEVDGGTLVLVGSWLRLAIWVETESCVAAGATILTYLLGLVQSCGVASKATS